MNFPNMPNSHQQQQTSRRDSVLSGGGLSFEVPTSSGHVGDSVIAERAALAARHSSGCCAVIARAKRGWVCLSCSEVHVVPRPSWYCPEKYQRRERVRRAVAVNEGKCAECGKPVCSENRRLCQRHRMMAMQRKRKARVIANRAARESLYGDSGQGFENGRAVFTARDWQNA